MSDITYDKNKEGVPEPAKPGICAGCKEHKPIVMVSSWGKYCNACAEVLWDKWHNPGSKDIGKHATGFDEVIENQTE